VTSQHVRVVLPAKPVSDSSHNFQARAQHRVAPVAASRAFKPTRSLHLRGAGHLGSARARFRGEQKRFAQWAFVPLVSASTRLPCAPACPTVGRDCMHEAGCTALRVRRSRCAAGRSAPAERVLLCLLLFCRCASPPTRRIDTQVLTPYCLLPDSNMQVPPLSRKRARLAIPEPGTRIFVAPVPNGLECSVCHDAYTDVRSTLSRALLTDLTALFSSPARVPGLRPQLLPRVPDAQLCRNYSCESALPHALHNCRAQEFQRGAAASKPGCEKCSGVSHRSMPLWPSPSRLW
jgi:hypothetical protein